MRALRNLQFRPVLTAFAAMGFAILVSLGGWQLHRLDWKRDLIAKVEARLSASPIPFQDAAARAAAGEDMEYAPVVTRGVYLAESQSYVFGAIDGKPGAFVFQPLKIAGGAVVYVNRGFAPQRLIGEPDLAAPEGTVTVSGLLRAQERPAPPASWFKPTDPSVDGLWFVRDPARIGAAAGLDAQGFYIDSFETDRAWPRGGTTRLDFRNRHLEYALTWFGLAACLAGVWLVFSLPDRKE